MSTGPWTQEPEQDQEPKKPPREPMVNLPGAITGLLAVMVAVQVFMSLAGPRLQDFVIATFAFIPARFTAGGMSLYPGGPAGLVWTFLTHLFVHGGYAHLFFNGIWLMAVGTPVARRLGSSRFLLFYFVCGIFSAATHLAGNLGSPVAVVGASGAISGCMAAALRMILFFNTRRYIEDKRNTTHLAPISDVRLIVITIVWILINVAAGAGLMPLPGQGSAGIAWEAHIGGFMAGLALIPWFIRWADAARRRTA
jgi:membrane associated rhomboid family serine protease